MWYYSVVRPSLFVCAYSITQHIITRECLGDYASLPWVHPAIVHRTRTAYAASTVGTTHLHAILHNTPRRVFSSSVLLHVDRLSSLNHGRLLPSPSGSSYEARLLASACPSSSPVFFPLLVFLLASHRARSGSERNHFSAVTSRLL